MVEDSRSEPLNKPGKEKSKKDKKKKSVGAINNETDMADAPKVNGAVNNDTIKQITLESDVKENGDAEVELTPEQKAGDLSKFRISSGTKDKLTGIWSLIILMEKIHFHIMTIDILQCSNLNSTTTTIN